MGGPDKDSTGQDGAADADKPSVIRQTDDAALRLARTVLRSARSGSIAVIEPETGGFPSVSRVLLGIDTDGSPVILVSQLSAHTRALSVDGRASLLVGETGKGDPLAHPRLTVQCTALPVARDSAAHASIRERFIRRHPKAKLYVDFPDFGFFKLTPQRASLNGGFGRAYLLTGEDLAIASPAIAALAEREARVVDHMNTDHRDAIDFYAREHCGASGEGWQIVGIDASGIDLALGDQLKRLEFPQLLQDAQDLRTVLKNLYA